MENPVALAGKHPYIAGAIVVGVGVLVILAFTGSGSSGAANNLGTSATAYQTAAAQNAAANSLLVQSQIAGQVNSHQSDNALADQINQDATAFKISQLNFDMQNNANVIAGNVATAQIAAAGKASDNALAATEAQYAYESLASNNALAASIDTNASTVQINGQNNDTAKSGIAAQLALGENSNATQLAMLNANLANGLALAKLNQAKTPTPTPTPTPNPTPANSGTKDGVGIPHPVYMQIPAPGGGYYPFYGTAVEQNGHILGGSTNQYR